ncbi:MAG TPA: hypothetical protein VLT17_05520, partial [Gemmatimonadales bacterium]|nr:hypothetical protein [Gemmatimonadales bacterium]
IFDITKLEWMNGQYLSALPADELLPAVTRELDRRGVKYDTDLHRVIDVVKIRSRTVLDIVDQVTTRLTTEPREPDEKARKFIAMQGEQEFRQGLVFTLSGLEKLPSSNWTSESTLTAIKEVAVTTGKKLGDVMQPVRIALTGSTVSEPVNELLGVVGRENTIKKIGNFLKKVPSSGT